MSPAGTGMDSGQIVLLRACILLQHTCARTLTAEAARLTKQHADEAARNNGAFSLEHSQKRKLRSFATKHAASAVCVSPRARTATAEAARCL